MLNYNLQYELESMIESGTATLVGSRAFGVHTPDSDTDIAMLWGDLPKSLMSERILDIRNYYSVLPLHNSGLLKLEGVDILLFDSPEDMAAITLAKADLKRIPKYLLVHKPTRVLLFENALNHYGWEDTRLVCN